MLHITFEFVGGPNDGKIIQGHLGEPSDAERHYLFSNRGRVGQRFAVASDYAIEALASEGQGDVPPFQRHHYVVTERLEDSDGVWVRAQYVPGKSSHKSSQPVQHQAAVGPQQETQPALQQQTRPGPGQLAGHLLVASPRMGDPWFERSVVLVLDESPDETFGIILNRPAKETVSRLWEDVSDIPCDNPRPVYVGGPENGPLTVLHDLESAADVPIVPGVFLSVAKERLERIVRQADGQQRLFVGMASWQAQQLDEELANGDWLILPVTKDLAFADPTDQWRHAVRACGRALLRLLGVKHFPAEPSMN